MKPIWLSLLLAIFTVAHSVCAGLPCTVRFDRPRYDIVPGESLVVQLVLDPAPEAGLHSFGISMLFDSAHARASDVDSISVAPALNFDGVNGPGAVRRAATGIISAKGTVDGLVAPISFSADPLLLTVTLKDLEAPGPYVLRAEFYRTLGPTEQIFVDGLGNVLDGSITFRDALVNYRPIVSVAAPVDGSTIQLPAAVLITAAASDLDGNVSKVEFYEGDRKIGETAVSPFQCSWLDPSPGLHRLTAVATDNLGATAKSAPLIITVLEPSEPNQSPVLTPIGGRIVNEGALLTFSATATDPDIPAQVLSFSLDGGAPDGADITAGGDFRWTPSHEQGGRTFSVTVRVTDNGTPPLSDSETLNIQVVAFPEPYAIFAGQANKPAGSKVLNWNGSTNQVSGRIHSNSDIDVSGNKHRFANGDVEFVTGIVPASNFGGKVAFEDSQLIESTIKPYPVDFRLADFVPGSPAAKEAQTRGKYYHIQGDTRLEDYIVKRVLREGLYYVEGKVHLSAQNLNGKATIVATDQVQLSVSKGNLEPYVHCLLIYSAAQTARYDKSAIDISGSSTQWRGIVFAPEGGIAITGNDNGALLGSLIGLGVDVGGSGFSVTGIDLSSCYPGITPVQSVALASMNSAARPVLRAALESHELILQFAADTQGQYSLEQADSVTASTWETVESISGDGLPHVVRVPTSVGYRFYRLRFSPGAPTLPAQR
ncbi:MAG: Ig-like domain-containing protein [Verrucomicrobiia bacterium]